MVLVGDGEGGQAALQRLLCFLQGGPPNRNRSADSAKE